MAKSKPIEYRGVVVEPSYESPHGTGRTCKTLQGWRILWPMPVRIARHCVRGEWCSTQKSAREKIDALRTIWEQGGGSTRAREQAVYVWGDSEAVTRTNAFMAAQSGRKTAEAVAADKRRLIERHGPALLSAVAALLQHVRPKDLHDPSAQQALEVLEELHGSVHAEIKFQFGG